MEETVKLFFHRLDLQFESLASSSAAAASSQQPSTVPSTVPQVLIVFKIKDFIAFRISPNREGTRLSVSQEENVVLGGQTAMAPTAAAEDGTLSAVITTDLQTMGAIAKGKGFMSFYLQNKITMVGSKRALPTIMQAFKAAILPQDNRLQLQERVSMTSRRQLLDLERVEIRIVGTSGIVADFSQDEESVAGTPAKAPLNSSRGSSEAQTPTQTPTKSPRGSSLSINAPQPTTSQGLVTFYIIEVRDKKRQSIVYQIRRRFSEFKSLRNNLKKIAVVSGHSESITFPSISSARNMFQSTSELVNKRVKLLPLFLDEAVAVALRQKNEAMLSTLRYFLGRDANSERLSSLGLYEEGGSTGFSSEMPQSTTRLSIFDDENEGDAATGRVGTGTSDEVDEADYAQLAREHANVKITADVGAIDKIGSLVTQLHQLEEKVAEYQRGPSGGKAASKSGGVLQSLSVLLSSVGFVVLSWLLCYGAFLAIETDRDDALALSGAYSFRIRCLGVCGLILLASLPRGLKWLFVSVVCYGIYAVFCDTRATGILVDYNSHSINILEHAFNQNCDNDSSRTCDEADGFAAQTRTDILAVVARVLGGPLWNTISVLGLSFSRIMPMSSKFAFGGIITVGLLGFGALSMWKISYGTVAYVVAITAVLVTLHISAHRADMSNAMDYFHSHGDVMGVLVIATSAIYVRCLIFKLHRAAYLYTLGCTLMVIYLALRLSTSFLPTFMKDAIYARVDAAVAPLTSYHLGQLRSIFVKFAQYLGGRADFLSDVWLRALSTLHDSCPPSSQRYVQKVIRSQFKRPINDVFESFDLNPVFSASIGQIHFAVLKTSNDALPSRQVVVKLQHDNISEIMKGDMVIALQLSRLAMRLDKRWKLMVDALEIWDKTMKDELDFCQEAANLNEVRYNYYHSNYVFSHERHSFPASLIRDG
jgi:ABC1 atypical kinase-like domain/PX domain